MFKDFARGEWAGLSVIQKNGTMGLSLRKRNIRPNKMNGENY